jgi:methylphosphotriester-DNA--protein-cysteine methyltransferase
VTYRLLGPDGPYVSEEPGGLGGHSKQGVYGRLDCPVALSLITRGKFKTEYRVFFRNADAARACGYRPCGACLRDEYKAWKAGTLTVRESRRRP